MAFSITNSYKVASCYIIVSFGIRTYSLSLITCGSFLCMIYSGIHALVGVLNGLINGPDTLMFICKKCCMYTHCPH